MGRIGYARISMADQNLDAQVDALKDAGCEKVYKEKASGVKSHRPKFDSMFESLREGDTLVVCKLDRVGLSVKHLMTMLGELEKRGVQFVSLGDGLDTSTDTGKVLYSVVDAFATFEHDLVVERTSIGLKSARARGRKGGRPRVSKEKVDEALRMYDKGASITQIMVATGLSNGMIYKYLNLRKKEG